MSLARHRAAFSTVNVTCSRCLAAIDRNIRHHLLAGQRVCDRCLRPDERQGLEAP